MRRIKELQEISYNMLKKTQEIYILPSQFTKKVNAERNKKKKQNEMNCLRSAVKTLRISFIFILFYLFIPFQSNKDK